MNVPVDSRPSRALRRARTSVLPLAAFTAALAFAPRADAQRIAIRGEFAGGTMLSPFQTQTLGFFPALQGTGRFGVSIIDPLAVQVSFSSWWFPRARGDGQLFAPTAGLRFEPRIGRVGRFFVDAYVGPGWTPDRWRVYLDVGLGFEFMITPWFGLGPVVRYGHFFHANETGGDAQFWSAGLSIVFRPGAHDDRERRERARARDRNPHDRDRDRDRDREQERARERERERERDRDTDHDGVRDTEDRCPRTADGRHPDPERRGCPLEDDDGDGIPDDRDRCPHQDAGRHPDPDRAGCPDGDADDDDVRDHEDQCPRQADGLHPDPARPGCPLPDRDGDNVPDADDACPTRAGAPSTDRRHNGCPGLVRIENNQIRILRPVFFATGHERILPQSQSVLIAVAEALRANPRIRHVSIDGHTDETGDPAHNLELSRQRADSVRDWLVGHGVDRDRLETHGYGETRPVVPGTTPAAHAQNRRVEFHISTGRH